MFNYEYPPGITWNHLMIAILNILMIIYGHRTNKVWRQEEFVPPTFNHTMCILFTRPMLIIFGIAAGIFYTLRMSTTEGISEHDVKIATLSIVASLVYLAWESIEYMRNLRQWRLEMHGDNKESVS